MDRPKLPLPTKVLRRFYEPLLLLYALGQIRGGRIKPDSGPSDGTGVNHRRLRRALADGIAYVCAYKKDPDFVTAAALEKSPGGIVVWLAANTNVRPGVEDFLKGVLRDLRFVAEGMDGVERQRRGEDICGDLTRKVVAFNQPRIQEYYKKAQIHVRSCLNVISEARKSADAINSGEDRNQIGRLESFLRDNFLNDSKSLSEPGLQTLVRECHSERHSGLFDSLKLFTGQGQTQFQKFEQLHKLLYKIAKHVTTCRKLIRAAVSLPQDLGQDFTIETIQSSTLQNMPLAQQKVDVASTVGRMFSSSEDQNKLLVKLQSIWDSQGLTSEMRELSRKKTRVHAELLLVNYFDQYGCDFLDGNDKYIGCSKPACYLCYAYIDNHPARYTLPASHQKLYVGWRVPDVYEREPQQHPRLEMQKDILLRLIDWVRRDLKTDMESREPPRPYHADSTIGLTSTSASLVNETTSHLSLLTLTNTSESVQTNFITAEEINYDQDLSQSSDEDGGVRLS